MVSSLVEIPSVGICLISLMVRPGLWVLERRAQRKRAIFVVVDSDLDHFPESFCQASLQSYSFILPVSSFNCVYGAFSTEV
jgi:hypothetical protein